MVPSPLVSSGSYFVLITFLILLCNSSVKPQDDDEFNALLYLKAALNNQLLNNNWTGLHCPINEPSRWYGIQCVGGRVTAVVLENVGLAGTISENVFLSFTELSVVSFKNNSIASRMMSFSFNPKLIRIDLSGNMFNGGISRSLLDLPLLESVQLQDNRLTGPIPELNQTSLKSFNVSNNNLTGEIPKTQAIQSLRLDSFYGNPGLCGTPSPISCTSDKRSKSNDFGLYFLLFDILGLLVIVLLFVTYYKKMKKLKKMMREYDDDQDHRRDDIIDDQKHDGDDDHHKISIEERDDHHKISIEERDDHHKISIEERDDHQIMRTSFSSTTSMKSSSAVVPAGGGGGGGERRKLIFVGNKESEARFEMGDLLKASAEGLGQGISGNSYKAMMEGKPAVVVKRLRDLKPLSSEEFTRQLMLMADLKHPNLLPLLAYFYSKDEKLLIFRYAHRGNLFNRLHEGRGSRERVPFRWCSRLSVARGVARALEYLHIRTTLPAGAVPHGNLKCSNILLDENDTVLVSDYGLASLIALPIASQRMVSYKSPEYQNAKRVSKKSDVWTYGCLLLELLTGKISAYAAPPGVNGVDICSWVHRAVREEWTAEIFDGEMSVNRTAAAHGMLRLLQIAMRCCDKSPGKRPEMTEVVREVENIKVIESEDEGDLSLDRSLSLTDDSMSTSTSGIAGDER